MPQTPKAVIFDLYDTLVYIPESKWPLLEFFSDAGLSQEEIAVAFHNFVCADYDGFGQFMQEHYPAITHDPAPYEAADKAKVDFSKILYFEETFTVLTKLKEKGLRLALVSNVSTAYKAAFHKLDLASYFDVIVLSSDLGFAKPDKEIYLHALQQLSIAPEEAIMIGDMELPDCDAPRALGIQGYLLDRNGTSGRPDALPSLTALLDLLA